MQKIKRILFYSIIIFSIMRSPHCYASNEWFEAAGKQVRNGVEKAGNIVGDAITKAAPSMGKELGEKLPALGSDGAKILSDGLANQLPTVGTNAATILGDKVTLLGDKVTLVGGAAIGAYSFFQLYLIGKQIRDDKYPGEEQKARINAAHEKNQAFDAKQEFRTCLINNTKTPRNASNRPTTCENLASMFAMMAGRAELDDMTENFKTAYPK